jgi:hypothetical protein
MQSILIMILLRKGSGTATQHLHTLILSIVLTVKLIMKIPSPKTASSFFFFFFPKLMTLMMMITMMMMMMMTMVVIAL